MELEHLPRECMAISRFLCRQVYSNFSKHVSKTGKNVVPEETMVKRKEKQRENPGCKKSQNYNVHLCTH